MGPHLKSSGGSVHSWPSVETCLSAGNLHGRAMRHTAVGGSMDWGRESSCGARLCDGLLGVGIDLFEDTFVVVLENTCKDKIVKIHENTMVIYGNQPGLIYPCTLLPLF